MFREIETQNLFYNLFGVVSWIMYFLYNYSDYKERIKSLGALGIILGDKIYLHSKPNKISKKRLYSRMSNVEIAVVTMLQIFPPLVTKFTVMFGKLLGTGANYLGIIILGLVVISIFCVIFWTDPIKLFDYITPSYAFALIFIKLACVCAGCCHGRYYEHGIFNYQYGRPEVPIQFIESGVALLIFVFLLFYKKKAKLGTMMPVYIMAYSGTRFFTEFLRGEDNIWGPLKNYHIQCIIFFIFGLILYVIAIKFGNNISNRFATTTYFKKGNLHERVVAVREYLVNEDFSKTSKKCDSDKRKRKNTVIK